MQRVVRLLIVVAVLLVGSAAAAFAKDGDGTISVSNENVSYDGHIDWLCNGCGAGGGMVVQGYLKDTKCNGHWVYADAKVHGYGYTRMKTNQNTCGDANRVWDAPTEFYDPAMTKASNGYVKVCQDDWLNDTCTDEYMTR